MRLTLAIIFFPPAGHFPLADNGREPDAEHPEIFPLNRQGIHSTSSFEISRGNVFVISKAKTTRL